MTIDRSNFSRSKTTRAAHTPLPMRSSDGDADRFRNSPPPPPLEWNVALQAAAAMLDETFCASGSLDDPLMADMVQNLAARLCAYDEIGTAVDQVQACPDVVPVKK
jgi:hypothetical protein